MKQRTFKDEALECRRDAAILAGRPDGAMLLRLATAFEKLDEERRASPTRMHHVRATTPDQHRR
jgi:hypothetical protein